MGKIVVSENLTLDGVVQDPTGEEGFRNGGWFGRVGARDLAEWTRSALDEAQRAQALLFGRRSYEFFAARWPTKKGQFAERLNSLPKFTISSTLRECSWTYTTVLAGAVPDEVASLKQQLDGELVVYASAKLMHTLLEHPLVDEL